MSINTSAYPKLLPVLQHLKEDPRLGVPETVQAKLSMGRSAEARFAALAEVAARVAAAPAGQTCPAVYTAEHIRGLLDQIVEKGQHVAHLAQIEQIRSVLGGVLRSGSPAVPARACRMVEPCAMCVQHMAK